MGRCAWLALWLAWAAASRSDTALEMAASAAADASSALLQSDCAGVSTGLSGQSAEKAVRSLSRCAKALQSHSHGRRHPHHHHHHDNLRSRHGGHHESHEDDLSEISAMVEKLEDDMKSGGVDKHSLDSQQQEVLDHLLERLTVMKKALTSGDSEEEDDVDYEERTYSHYGKHKSHTEDSSDEGNSSDEPLVDSPEHSSEDSNSKHSSEEDSPCAETKETLLAIEGELKKLHSGHHSDDHSHSHSHHNSHHGSHHGHSQDNDEAEEDDGVDAEIEEERKELEEMTDKLDPDHKTSDHSRETDLSSMSHDTFEDRVSHGDTNIGDSGDSSKEASEEEARLVEQVALQSAKVARISNELKAAEGNGKRTIEDVQKDLKEKNEQAEEAHQELKAQHGIFEQVKQQREEIGNSTAKQRQVAADAEAKHMAAKAAFEQEKRKLEQLQRQKEDADKAVTKAEVTRTETQEKVHVDTSELREHVSKLDELNAELNAVQEKERLEAVPPKRPVTAIDAEDPDEGFISKVLHSIGL